MTLTQVAQVKQWLRLHGWRHPLERHAWDLVLTTWVMGLMGVPVLLVLGTHGLLPLCLAAYVLPALYASVRSRLHRAGRLRCDWLTAL